MPTASLQRLSERALILKRLRQFFEQRNFLEVETPLLSHDTCVDRHLQPIGVAESEIFDGATTSDLEPQPFYLQTSPEFAMKRILAAGATAIFQISKSFRAGERGRLHNPEFSMLEWYRVGDDLHSGMELLATLVRELLGANQVLQVRYHDLFLTRLNVDPQQASLEALVHCAIETYQIATTDTADTNSDRDYWLNLLLTHAIEPTLGFDYPTIIYDWPATQSALAIVRQEHPPVAERFELYVCGMEIANGYHELLDAAELSGRNEAANRARRNDGKSELPVASRLLAAMRAGIPSCAGVALGVDRLVMLLTGAESIDEVIAFPIERA